MMIGIDFDGICVKHVFPSIGDNIGAVPALKELVDNGHKLTLFTMRSDIGDPKSSDYNIHPERGEYLTDAVNWFKKNGIPLYGINENQTNHLGQHPQGRIVIRISMMLRWDVLLFRNRIKELMSIGIRFGNG